MRDVVLQKKKQLNSRLKHQNYQKFLMDIEGFSQLGYIPTPAPIWLLLHFMKSPTD